MPPLYDWQCDKCKKIVSIVRPFSEYDMEPDEKCECGSEEPRKKVLSKGVMVSCKGEWNQKGPRKF